MHKQNARNECPLNTIEIYGIYKEEHQNNKKQSYHVLRLLTRYLKRIWSHYASSNKGGKE
jgi:hypothetical protein